MSIFDFRSKEAVRIKVKLCKGSDDAVYKQFSIDPHITSFEVLQRILARAFALTLDFDISYLATDDYGEQFYLPMLSDWDLDAAIFTASDPVLRMKVDLHVKSTDRRSTLLQRAYNNSFEDVDVDIFVINYVLKEPSYWKSILEDEEVSQTAESSTSPTSSSDRSATVAYSSSRSIPFNGSILSQFSHHMGRTVNSVQRAIGGIKIGDFDSIYQSKKSSKNPMNDTELRKYLDNIGRLIMPREFRYSIYAGGLEPCLRKVGWRLLLDIYPLGLTGQERLSFLRLLSQQYTQMKTAWKEAYAAGRLSQQQVSLIASISMDVVRTDRTHNFYSGESRENSNLSQLFDLLVTYSLYHPTVGYSQGMSDLASPLLYIQSGEEGSAYVCFCALMRRLKANFASDGQALITKLQHLHDLLVYYDPNFALFLRQRGLADMFFAHRWLLLELKREFSFEESLRVLEVQWAAIPQTRIISTDWESTAKEERDVSFGLLEAGINVETFKTSVSISPKEPQKHNPYMRLQSMRRHSANSIRNNASSPSTDSMTKKSNVIKSHYRGHDLRLMNSLMEEKYQIVEANAHPNIENSDSASQSEEPHAHNKRDGSLSYVEEIEEDSKDIAEPDSPTSPCASQREFSTDERVKNINYGLIVIKDGVVELPPPSELGYGNPFLLFLCLSLLFEYREAIMQNVHEMFDFAQFFRRLNQNHDLNSVLGRARHMFDEYIRDQETRRRKLISNYAKTPVQL